MNASIRTNTLLVASSVVALFSLSACGSSQAAPLTPTTSSTAMPAPSTTLESTTAPTTAAPTPTIKAVSAVVSGPVSGASRLTGDGLAGIRVGRTVAAASASTGQHLEVSPPVNGYSCSVSNVPVDGVNVFLKADHTVWAIEVFGDQISTDTGLRIGSSVSDVLKSYPNATRIETSYGASYVAKSASGHELLFQTNGETVAHMFAGTAGIENQDEYCG